MMAHGRLKGVKKPRLQKIKKKNKRDRDSKTKEERKGNGENKPTPAKVVVPQTGGIKMNKKEARHKATLEKMHRDLYAGGERILLVGEGNFTFARALCKHVGGAGVYASSLDSEADLRQKYRDEKQCRSEIEETLGGTCLTGVDGTRLHKAKEFRGAFRKIVFNFPHLGSGEKDVETSIGQHRQLMAAFFASAVKCLDPKQESFIHVALKTGEPYKSWKVVQTARAACPELELKTAVPFMPSAWEGYEHRRTAGFSEKFSLRDSEELAKGAKVYVFRRPRSAGGDDG